MTQKVYVVGLGPGGIEQMTQRAKAALESCDVIAGYHVYIDLIKNDFTGKEFLTTGMRKEVDRCKLAIEEALKGKTVAMISSGDAGVIGDDVEAVGKESEVKYGIPVLTVPCYGFLDGEYYQGYFAVAEQLAERFFHKQTKLENTALLIGDNGGPWGHYAKEVKRLLAYFSIKVIGQFPGYIPINELPQITAACSGAAVLGAPLISDFCLISLSDLLTPWEKIEKRLDCASQADFCICLYNPSSFKRHDYLQKACDIMLKNQRPDVPAGIVRNIGRDGENYEITTLQELRDKEVDMFSTVIIGNSQTEVINGKLVTPRGYKL